MLTGSGAASSPRARRRREAPDSGAPCSTGNAAHRDPHRLSLRPPGDDNARPPPGRPGMAASELCHLSASDAVARFKARTLSPVELVGALMARHGRWRSASTPPPSSTTSVRWNRREGGGALRETRREAATPRGVPVMIKDQHPIKGERNPQSARIVEGWTCPPRLGTVSGAQRSAGPARAGAARRRGSVVSSRRTEQRRANATDRPKADRAMLHSVLERADGTRTTRNGRGQSVPRLRSHSCSFDQRLRPDTALTAMARARRCPTRTTRRRPRVTPV